jgi:hypothetical protein
MSDPSLQGGIPGVPYGNGLVCHVSGEDKKGGETMTMAETTKTIDDGS